MSRKGLIVIMLIVTFIAFNGCGRKTPPVFSGKDQQSNIEQGLNN